MSSKNSTIAAALICTFSFRRHMKDWSGIALAMLLANLVSNDGFAHDVKDLFGGFDPNREIERSAQDLQRKIAAAEAAGVPAEAIQASRFIYWAGMTWPTRIITLCFWNGSTNMQKYVMRIASVWSEYGNIEFSYSVDGKNRKCEGPDSADIRVSLDRENPPNLYESPEFSSGDWSFIGVHSLGTEHRVSLSIPDVPLEINRDLVWVRHAIRHEFGHALGLMHEHQRELCDAWFDFDRIAKDDGWTVEKAKQQVGKLPTSELAYIQSVGEYDKNSIMQYNFDESEFKVIPGIENPCLRDKPIDNLSAKDIAGIQALYGPSTSVATTKTSGEKPAAADISRVSFRSVKLDEARSKLKHIEMTLTTPALPDGSSEQKAEKERLEKQKEALQAVTATLNQFESLLKPR